uniref:Uncharacterized protein n=1 Tax=Cajanus cajan TaxID=3821 RepID=A0A151UB67_CAJCA|nr:hypothetical protein KK1_020768 [Cajanus cajan]
MEKEGLVEVVEDIDDDVIIAGGVDVGSREFTVDENNLLGHTRRRESTVRDVPCEIEVRVFALHRGHCPCQEAYQQ